MNAAGTTSEHQREREQRLLTVVCLGAFLFFNSLGSINVALPTIQMEFGSSLAAVQWISIIGVVMISSLSLCFGRAGNLLGQRRLYKTGVTLYALGAGLSAMLSSLGTTAVALIETIMSRREIHDASGFSAAQQSAFSSLLPLAVAPLIISFAAWRWSRLKG